MRFATCCAIADNWSAGSCIRARNGLRSDGFISFWGKGISFTEDYEIIALKGSCGFADKTQCHINITKWGVQEWWLQLKTSDGVTGWILGLKQSGGKVSLGPNSGYACRD